ncbi:MAG: hypothetical protein AAF623_07090, partial [Planctomycetota bacterium]
GVTAEQLSEMRSNNEIFGYRDGTNWKFKFAELERVAEDMGIELKAGDGGQDSGGISDSFGFDLSDSDPGLSLEPDSEEAAIQEPPSEEYIEDSSVELLQQPPSEEISAEIDLGDDDELQLADSGILAKGTDADLPIESALKLNEDADDILASDDSIFDEDELSFGSSSIKLASGSGKKGAGDTGPAEDPAGTGSDTGKLGSGPTLDDDLLISEDDDLFSDELSLADSASFEDSAELSSDFEDSDLILDDSDSSTEITLEANESGINLKANESGISLSDAPLELGGSDIDALELPEDDEMIVLEDSADPDADTLMPEDDFNLTPLESSMDEDDSSGSQVIALEDSEIYADDSAATILGESGDFGAEPQMLDDMDAGGMIPYQDGALATDAPMMMPGGSMAPAAMAAGPAAPPEAPFSLWQVLSLGLVASILVTGGMVAYNVAQNMWMAEDQIIGKGVLNFFLKMTGME